MQKLGRFEILEEIGRGGCGVVYKALDPKIGRHVAIKTILPEAAAADATLHTVRTPSAATGPASSQQSSLYQRLLIEAQAAGRLSHPNIVTVHELDEQDSTTFIVMELVAGRTLSALIAEGAARPETAIAILRQMADALDHAHQHGIVHRDIKPANVLLTPQNHVKVTDFGIAKVLQGQLGLTRTGAAMGTALYMSPEQIETKPVSAQTDQFALGVIGYELLAGARPFFSESWAGVLHQILNVDPPPVSNHRPELSEHVTVVLRRALAKQAPNRYPSCAEFVGELERAVSGAPAMTRTPASREQPKPKAANWLLPVAAGAAIALLAGSWVVYRALESREDAGNEAPAVVATNNSPAASIPAPQPASEPPARPSEKAAPQGTKSATPAAPVAAPSPVPSAAAPQQGIQQQPQVNQPPPQAPIVQQPPPPVSIPAASVAESAPKTAAVPLAIPPDERAWQELANSRNVAALEQFRRDYPSSPHARTAADRVAQLEAERVRATQAAEAKQTRQSVDAAVERYRVAFEHRSMEELRRVWPGLGQQEQTAFQNFFRNAKSVSMTLRVQGEPEIAGDNATVRAIRTMQMTSERGREPAQENPVVIRMRRSGQEMQIESVTLAR